MNLLPSSLVSTTVRVMLLVSFIMAQLAMAVKMGTSSYASAQASTRLNTDEMRAYILPDGTLPVFCNPAGADESVSSHSMCDGCACSCPGCVSSATALLDVDFPELRGVLPDKRLIIRQRFFLTKARAPPAV